MAECDCARCWSRGRISPVMTSLARPPRDAPGFVRTTCSDSLRYSRICGQRFDAEAVVLSKLCRTCKLNFAAMSVSIRSIALKYSAILDVIRVIAVVPHLDSGYCAAYFKIHTFREICSHVQARCQGRASQTTRRAQPESGAGARALVPGRRVLRCPRSGTGEVRDVAAGEPRGRIQSRSRGAVRSVASHLLSGRSSLCPRRTGGAATAPAGAEGRAQAQARGDELYRAAPRGRRSNPRPHAGAQHRDRARRVGTSPQHRARNGAQKKP